MGTTLQAALNGPYTKDDHPAMPVTAAELATDARACVAAGARMIHLHPRDQDGCESLSADVIDAVVREVRAACGVPVGVSTGAWIEPDLEKRLALIAAWTEPDYASVNVSEDGALEVMRALRERQIGVEAGVWSVEDARKLATAQDAHGGLTRILIEPVDADPEKAVALVATIRREATGAPLLQHGDGAATWTLLEDAVRAGIDTRIGLEDTREADNPTLVRRAMSFIRDGGL
ncbi:MAG TPA: 3-keto-5-aminohexanoate cleavage protein [Solirubrobacteraceae bacterium]|nr:3-keto-5-aminohexanoate cleavage protein [Solirubrobacteraceae bacterium]